MTGDSSSDGAHRHGRVSRRGFLRTATVGVTVAATGVAGAAPDGAGGGFPPAGTTTFGERVRLGCGEVRPFTTATPSGEVRYHGVEFDREVVSGPLPDADTLAADRRSDDPTYDDAYGPDGLALEIHRRESLEFFVPFPDAEDSPFTVLGLNWNPAGHPGGRGAWSKPHFDVHFHMLDAETVDAIEGPGPAPYDDIADAKIPAGYARSPPPTADERYITDMGEHLAPTDAPELPATPEAFTNTLIQGFVCVDGTPELAFVEPMVTREFLEQVAGTERYDVPQPAVYPHANQHPTAYSVRADPSDGTVVVALEAFDGV